MFVMLCFFFFCVSLWPPYLPDFKAAMYCINTGASLSHQNDTIHPRSSLEKPGPTCLCRPSCSSSSSTSLDCPPPWQSISRWSTITTLALPRRGRSLLGPRTFRLSEVEPLKRPTLPALLGESGSAFRPARFLTMPPFRNANAFLGVCLQRSPWARVRRAFLFRGGSQVLVHTDRSRSRACQATDSGPADYKCCCWTVLQLDLLRHRRLQ